MKKTLWLITKVIFAVSFPFVLVPLSHCQDIRVNCSNTPTCTLATNLAWSNGNQNFIFQPQYVSESVAIYIRNRNTTSAHTSQTVTVWQTGNPDTTLSLSLNADQFVQDNLTLNSIVGATLNSVNAAVAGTPGASGTGFGYISSMFAAQVVIRITGAATSAGSPDTFDLFVVQDKGYVAGPQPGGDDTAGGGSGIVFGSAATLANGGGNLSLMRVPECDLPLLGNCFPAFGLAMYSGTGKAAAVDMAAYANAGIGAIAAGSVLSGLAISQSVGNFIPFASQNSGSATASSNATGTTLGGIGIVTGPANWTVATQATTASACVSQLAASATTRHCATGVEACVSDTAAQPQLFLNLRDGATGAGTVRWNALLDGTAGTSSCIVHEFSAGPICGTINTAMTLEFGAATAATNGCTTTIKGYDVL